MLPGERHQKILELLVRNKSISVASLCDALEASEATIRRDLTTLEADGKLERTHGGAMLNYQSPVEYEATFNQKELLQASHKKAIAKRAFRLLRDNESVFLDAGTTTLELAHLIGQSNLHLMVITNSNTLSQAISANPHVDLYVVGGKVRLNTLATVGTLAVETIKRFNVSKTFIGVNGITVDNGLTTPDMEEAETKRAMLSIGRERIVLADYTKFNSVAMCQIAPISMIDAIVTDKEIQRSFVDSFESNDIKMLIAD